jgi:hypothetical protein
MVIKSDLFRGARPVDIRDLRNLEALGVRTIISLEEGLFSAFRWAREPAIWRAMGYTWYQVKLSAIVPPTRGQLDAIRALIHVSQAHYRPLPEDQPTAGVFVHCYSGVDRTGMVIADWRVTEQEHDPKQAWAECIRMGMHHRYQLLWKRAFFKLEKTTVRAK